jgi:hypothetical protein
VLLRSPVEARAEVSVAPEVVWATVSDPETYPDWLVGAQRIRAVDDGFPAPGSRMHHSVGPTSAITVDDRTVATRSDPPHRLDLRVHAGLFHADVQLLLQPSPGGGTEICFRERPRGISAPLTPLLRPILHARNAESLRRLCHRLEPSSWRG